MIPPETPALEHRTDTIRTHPVDIPSALPRAHTSQLTTPPLPTPPPTQCRPNPANPNKRCPWPLPPPPITTVTLRIPCIQKLKRSSKRITYLSPLFLSPFPERNMTNRLRIITVGSRQVSTSTLVRRPQIVRSGV